MFDQLPRLWPFGPSSTKITSSPCRSAVRCSSGCTSSAVKKRWVPSSDHSNRRMPLLWSDSFDASPPSSGITQICAPASAAPPRPPPPAAALGPAAPPAWSRVDRNAISLPSGDHCGLVSCSLPRNWNWCDPSVVAIQIDETRRLSFHAFSSDFANSTRVPSGEICGPDTCTRSSMSSSVGARRVWAAGTVTKAAMAATATRHCVRSFTGILLEERLPGAAIPDHGLLSRRLERPESWRMSQMFSTVSGASRGVLPRVSRGQ